MKLPRNWKTTLAGAVAILGVVSKLVNGGAVNTEDLSAIIAGIGLIAARDHDNHAAPAS